MSARLRLGTAADLPRLASGWRDLYEQQAREGMRTTLPGDAFERWAMSVAPSLGRFAQLHLAEEEPDVVGFVLARLRATPPHLGGERVGFVSEVWVAPGRRKHGLGPELLQAALEWFRAQGVSRCELHVMAGNTGARRFYAREGWSEELVQLVLELPPSGLSPASSG